MKTSNVLEHRSFLLLSAKIKEAYIGVKFKHHNSNYRYLSLMDVNTHKHMGRTTCFQN